jgi:hypothetical protein
MLISVLALLGQHGQFNLARDRGKREHREARSSLGQYYRSYYHLGVVAVSIIIIIIIS